VLKAIEYDSFGNVINDTNSVLEIPFGFAGGLHDKDTNLIRFGYRDFDPETGRWTARDPIGFAGGDTNLYGYVASDPINFVDPNGLFSLTQGLTIIELATVAKGIYDNNQNQRELRDMRESITHANSVVKGCVSGKCPMPYSDLSSYVDALDRVTKTYIEKTGQSGFDLAESLSGKKTGGNQLPKTLPFCD
jgi:RHS repeat-associated protein